MLSNNDVTVLLEPVLKLFDDFTADGLVFDNTFAELEWSCFELRL